MHTYSGLVARANEASAKLDGEAALFDGLVKASLRGDPSLIPVVAKVIGSTLVHEDEIPTNYRVWLALVLAKIVESPDLCRAVSGKNGRGAPKKGFESVKIALEVMIEIVERDAATVDAAHQAVAERKHLSMETVRQYWQENQSAVWLVYGQEIREHMGFQDLAAAVKAMTADARARKAGKK